MSLKHLAAGSSFPPLDDGALRLYSMAFCPYAQRARLVLAAKNIPHEIVNVNLKHKPEWLFEKNRHGKVPILEKDGRIISESLIISDYLDNMYPDKSLYPSGSYEKAKDQMMICIIDEFSGLMKKIYTENTTMEEVVKGLEPGLRECEKELQSRGSDFFGGSLPSMVDLMIWPWFERFPLLEKVYPSLSVYKNYPFIHKWYKKMKEHVYVQPSYITPEGHHKFWQSYKTGEPNYDIQL